MSPFSVLKEQSLQTTAKKFFYSLLKLKPKSKTLEDNLLLKKKKKPPYYRSQRLIIET